MYAKPVYLLLPRDRAKDPHCISAVSLGCGDTDVTMSTCIYNNRNREKRIAGPTARPMGVGALRWKTQDASTQTIQFFFSELIGHMGLHRYLFRFERTRYFLKRCLFAAINHAELARRDTRNTNNVLPVQNFAGRRKFQIRQELVSTVIALD